MEENLKWLWWAFGSAWIIHILYLVTISAREKKLRQQLDHLRTLLKEHEGKAGGDS
jgi:bacteriorhodopsin